MIHSQKPAAKEVFPKFVLDRFDTTITIRMNNRMGQDLLSLLQEFEMSELESNEFAFIKQLEELVDQEPKVQNCQQDD